MVKEVAWDKQDLKAMLEEQAGMAGHLVCFLDCDREGENIAFEVLLPPPPLLQRLGVAFQLRIAPRDAQLAKPCDGGLLFALLCRL